jgi:hypothetical protein
MIASAALLLACTANAERPDHALLSTTVLARQILALQGPNAAMNIHPDALKARVATIRRDVGAFIIRQIEVYPSISECDLQKQLASAFAVKNDGCGPRAGDVGIPRVFAESWGPNSIRRVFVVTYLWFGFYGNGGSETVLESYVWERDRGVHLGTGVVPASFSGLLTQAEQVCWFIGSDKYPDKYWVLISGIVGGASGRVHGGSASLFEIGTEGERVVWSAPQGIGNVRAYVPPLSLRWEIEYADVKRSYGDLPNATLLDIYQVDFSKQTYHRIAHVPLD